MKYRTIYNSKNKEMPSNLCASVIPSNKNRKYDTSCHDYFYNLKIARYCLKYFKLDNPNWFSKIILK